MGDKFRMILGRDVRVGDHLYIGDDLLEVVGLEPSDIGGRIATLRGGSSLAIYDEFRIVVIRRRRRLR